jgi:sigma-E factor negative regulatory protein RseB
VEMVSTTLDAHGWQPMVMVPGFREIHCFERPWGAIQDANRNGRSQASSGVSSKALQVIYSDGLTHVSVFIEPFDAARHGQQVPVFVGATRAFSTRLADWWITAVGDVPLATLRSLAQGLQRKK